MPRKNVHPNKEIEAAVSYAEDQNWTWLKASGHAWGILRCPKNDRLCRNGLYCQISIWSTPRNPTGHARSIRRAIDKCKHSAASQATALAAAPESETDEPPSGSTSVAAGGGERRICSDDEPEKGE